jgi:mgtE-like transporter
MPHFLRRVGARFVALVRTDPTGVRAGFVALLISSATGLVAGLILGSITDTLESFPGLLILVPAAVGMRGNVFGALASRLGTAVHAGTFRLSARVDTLVGQNLASSVALSMGLGLVLAVAARGYAVVFGVHQSISLADYVVVSVVGGLIPIAVVMAITLGVAALSVRRAWDLDNVAAPVVTAAADSITLPSLFLATALVRVDVVTPVLALVCAAVALFAFGAAAVSRLPLLRRVVRESVGVLILSGLVSMLAGLTLESRLGPLLASPIVLVVVPPLLSLSGSLAGILASRLSTKLHLGLVQPDRNGWRGIAEDIALVYMLAGAIFLVLALVTEGLGGVLSLEGPNIGRFVLLVLLAGLLATTLANVVGYVGAVVTYRFGLDPDNFGIPLVSSASDLLGAVSLILSLALLGLA